jgi:glycosyltransferase involved in cell wall biosynthesis
MKISVVITVFNEEENVKPLLEKLYQSLNGIEYEVIFVDDGSTDRTVEVIKQNAWERVKVVIFNKNSGQTAAMAAGINQAMGEFIVLMDGDLQNDPADIPLLLTKIEEEHFDLVAGHRVNRQDGFILRKLPSKIANKLIRKLTGVKISDYGCSLKIFRKDIAKNMQLYGELHRFLPILAKLEGAKITEMPVRHFPRIHGTSKYGINRTFKVMSDLLLMLFFQKYFQKPMHLFGTLGILTFFAGMLINAYMGILKVFGEDIWGRPLLLLGVLLTIGGMQLVTFGVIAELIMRTYYESQSKTTYRVKEVFVGQAKPEADKVEV